MPMLRTLVAAALLTVAAPAAAAEMPNEKQDEIGELLEKAIGEHTTFLNCTWTMPSTFNLVRDGWVAGVAETVVALQKAGFDPDDLADFSAKASLDSMLMRESSFEDVADFCSRTPEFEKDIYLLKYVILPLHVQAVIDR